MDTVQTTNESLARRLLELTAGSAAAPARADSRPGHSADVVVHDADAIVAHIEVNDHHGVGVLLGKLFGHCSNILSIRSNNFYEGRQNFGDLHLCISHGKAARDAMFWRVLQALNGSTVKRVLCKIGRAHV